MFHKTIKSSAQSDLKFKGSEPMHSSILGSTHASTLDSDFPANKTERKVFVFLENIKHNRKAFNGFLDTINSSMHPTGTNTRNLDPVHA